MEFLSSGVVLFPSLVEGHKFWSSLTKVVSNVVSGEFVPLKFLNLFSKLVHLANPMVCAPTIIFKHLKRVSTTLLYH